MASSLLGTELITYKKYNVHGEEGKKGVVIGSGASAVEVVETALERGSGVCRVLAMDDKVRSFFVVMWSSYALFLKGLFSEQITLLIYQY